MHSVSYDFLADHPEKIQHTLGFKYASFRGQIAFYIISQKILCLCHYIDHILSDENAPCMGFVVPLYISVAVNIMLPQCLYINDWTDMMDRTAEFGVKKNVLTFLYQVGVWPCHGGFAQKIM